MPHLSDDLLEQLRQLAKVTIRQPRSFLNSRSRGRLFDPGRLLAQGPKFDSAFFGRAAERSPQEFDLPSFPGLGAQNSGIQGNFPALSSPAFSGNFSPPSLSSPSFPGLNGFSEGSTGPIRLFQGGFQPGPTAPTGSFTGASSPSSPSSAPLGSTGALLGGLVGSGFARPVNQPSPQSNVLSAALLRALSGRLSGGGF